MAITQTQTTSFKRELYEGVHNFLTDTFKIALYTPDAVLGHDTTVYTTVGEVVGANYTAGGLTLSGATISTALNTAYITFNSPITWTSVTFTTRGALIYNASKGNKAVAVYDFGQNMNPGLTAVLNLVLPNNTADEALIRVL
jgi:hypothetical protein